MKKEAIIISLIIAIIILLLAFQIPKKPELSPTSITIENNILSLENGKTNLKFSVDPSGQFGLVEVKDILSDYIHTTQNYELAWEISLWDHSTAPNYQSIKQNSNSPSIKSHSTNIYPDGTAELTLIWSQLQIELDTFNVVQKFTLKPDDLYAKMRLSVEGSNLNSHSVEYIAPMFYYNELPLNSKSSFNIRNTFLINNPQTYYSFRDDTVNQQNYNAYSNTPNLGQLQEQIANGIYSIFPAQTQSYLGLFTFDPEGFVAKTKWQGTGTGLRIHFLIYGDKQTLPKENFEQPYDIAIGGIQGEKEQDWYHSAIIYRDNWYSKQSFFPEKLLDRTDIPEYMKNLQLIHPYTPPIGGSSQRIIEDLTTIHNRNNLESTLTSVWGASLQNSYSTYTMSPELENALPSVTSEGVRVINYMGADSTHPLEPLVLTNPQLFAPIKIYDMQGNPARQFKIETQQWQDFQVNNIIPLIQAGLTGVYLDVPARPLHFDQPQFGLQQHYGGGSRHVQGLIQAYENLRTSLRPIQPDYVHWTEPTAIEQLIKSVDFTLNEANSLRWSPQALGSLTPIDQQDFSYEPIDIILTSGHVVNTGASDRSWAWGVQNAYDYNIQSAKGLSHGRVPTVREEPTHFIYFNPNGQVSMNELGLSYDPTTWTPAGSLAFPDINTFLDKQLTTLKQHTKYTRFGILQREPITTSEIYTASYYDRVFLQSGVPSPFPTIINFEKLPTSAWIALDGSMGILTINPDNGLATNTITINFEDYPALTPGNNYRLYKKDINGLTYIDTKTDTFNIQVNYEPFDIITYEIIDEQTDPDNDGEANLRYDTLSSWDNCPNTANINQLDSDSDGFGDACDCDINDPSLTNNCPNPDPDPNPDGGNPGGGGPGGGSPGNPNGPSTPSIQCSDGIDNDNDGLIDLNDPGCSSATDNSELDSLSGLGADSQCEDGLDNDLDGLTDFPDDPDCETPNDNLEESDSPQPLNQDENNNFAFWTIISILIVAISVVFIILLKRIKSQKSLQLHSSPKSQHLSASLHNH